MNMSETIINLGKALVGFHGDVEKVAFDGRNPQYRSKYVTLDALIDATKPILQKHGLSILQFPITSEDGKTGIKSMLVHESGEFIESEPLFMQPVRMVKGGAYEQAPDPQAAGSTISYLRRYSYQAILSLSTGEDDDGEKAMGRSSDNARENTTEPSEDRSSRRERVETTDTTEESSNTTDERPRRSRRESANSNVDEKEPETNTEETTRRGSRRSTENNSSTAQGEEITRRGSRRRE